mgnify:CR=1 FL=1
MTIKYCIKCYDKGDYTQDVNYINNIYYLCNECYNNDKEKIKNKFENKEKEEYDNIIIKL